MGDFQDIQQRETGLKQHLTSAQMVMIAIGGAVGTGLFMGSAFAIGFAGPAVLVSYAIGAFIAVLLPKRLHKHARRGEAAATGIASGVLTGFAGMPGPPVVPFYLRRPIPPAVARASIQPRSSGVALR